MSFGNGVSRPIFEAGLYEPRISLREIFRSPAVPRPFGIVIDPKPKANVPIAAQRSLTRELRRWWYNAAVLADFARLSDES